MSIENGCRDEFFKMHLLGARWRLVILLGKPTSSARLPRLTLFKTKSHGETSGLHAWRPCRSGPHPNANVTSRWNAMLVCTSNMHQQNMLSPRLATNFAICQRSGLTTRAGAGQRLSGLVRQWAQRCNHAPLANR